MLWRWRTGRELVPAKPATYGEDEGAHGGAERGPAMAADLAATTSRATAATSAPRARSVWDELDAEAAHAGSDVDEPDADNVTSLADHWSSGGTRGEGGR